MSKGSEDAIQPPPTPDVSYMDWINENKLMIILAVVIIAALVWYFWFRHDGDDITVVTPNLTADELVIRPSRK